MKNFDYLQGIKGLGTLYKFCNAAEETQMSDADTCALNCRKALEHLVHTLCRLEKEPVGARESLLSLTSRSPYTKVIANTEKLKMATDYIRKIGNIAAHTGGVTKREAFFTLLNTYNIVGTFVLRFEFAEEVKPFNNNLIPRRPSPFIKPKEEEVKAVSPEIIEQVKPEVIEEPKVSEEVTDNRTEAETRRLFIDLLLKEAGWEVMEQKNLPSASKAGIEIEVHGLPSGSGTGFCDYVLYGDDGLPLAVIEAKRTSVKVEEGRKQAEDYAKCLYQQYGVEPVIYYTNGFHTFILDGFYSQPREMMGFHTLDDLKTIHFQRNRKPLEDLKINDNITNRPYQKRAIRAVCDHLNQKNRRALLVMATGTGKTRTAISICDVLLKNHWIKNVLFLADRTTLVEQACKNFNKLLPEYTSCILTGSSKEERKAALMFSTYNAMMGYIDSDDKEFSVGRFDLIILDEAHRSVYAKYTAIFSYFDSLLIGLTATPREDVDKNTFDLFKLDGEPNFEYSMEEAVSDNPPSLVDYVPLSRTTKRLREGIKQDDLTEEEKEQLDEVWEYEQAKKTEQEGVPQPKTPRDIESKELFTYIYNQNTIDLMIQDLMDNGLKVNSGNKIGKSIIFAYDHDHALLIVNRFYELYSQYDRDFCQLIDYTVKDGQDLINHFELRNEMPQIAVSVAMLDTGVDVPDILNLVIFKPVYSTIKYIQMIGRGTRLSEGIFDDGSDKKEFYVFDWCENFEFFNEKPKGKKTSVSISLTERLFNLKTQVAIVLQYQQYQEDEFAKGLCERLKKDLYEQVCQLNEKHIKVREKWDYVTKYKQAERWVYISELDGMELKAVAPLIQPAKEDSKALMFDALMFSIELSSLIPDITATLAKNKVMKIAQRLMKKASLPQVQAKMETIKAVAKVEFWKDADLPILEKVREDLRGLLKSFGTDHKSFPVNIEDTFEPKEGVEKPKLYVNYRTRILDYLHEHQDIEAINKIYRLEKLSREDIIELERICWKELGTKEKYDRYVKKGEMICGDKVAVFIRSIVKVDIVKAKELFSKFLSNTVLNSLQEEYLNQIINYVCNNGDIQPIDLFQDETLSNYQWGVVFGENLPRVGNYIRELHEMIA